MIECKHKLSGKGEGELEEEKEAEEMMRRGRVIGQNSKQCLIKMCFVNIIIIKPKFVI